MALSDILTPSFCEVGKVKIGGLGEERQKRGGGTWRPPVKLDHFVLTTLHRDDKGLLIPDAPLMESLKDFRDADGRLRAIPVMFPSNNPDDLMTSAYVWYVGKRLGARADGRTMTLYLDPKTAQPLDEPRLCRWDPEYLDWPDPKQAGKRLFKLFTTLNVMVASPAARWGGFYRFRTTSEISARQLYGSLVHLRQLTGGVLRGLVFRLVVRPLLVAPEGKASTVYVVHVEYTSSDLRQLQATAREALELERANVEAVRQLEAGYRQLVAAQADDEPDDDLIAEEPKALPAAAQQPAGPTAEQLGEQAIDAAETADELKATWSALTTEKNAGRLAQDAYDRLATRKDKKKAALAPAPQPAPANQPQPAAERPADAGAVHDTPAAQPAAAPAKAGQAIVADILKRCAALGLSWGDFRAEHAEALGIAGYRAQDLTPDQALKLVEILKREEADAAATTARNDPEPEEAAEAAGVN